MTNLRSRALGALCVLAVLSSGGPAIAAGADGSLTFVEHPDCTEIRLAPANSMAWHMGTPAGGADARMLRALGTVGRTTAYPLGPVDRVARVTIDRQGAATPAFDPSGSYLYHNYWLAPSRRRNVAVAEFITGGRPSLYDFRSGDLVPFQRFDNYRYFFGRMIVQATLYYNGDPQASTEAQPCGYAANQDEARGGFFSGKCVWLDAASRSSSGKPFCFSSSASTRVNDAADMALPEQ